MQQGLLVNVSKQIYLVGTRGLKKANLSKSVLISHGKCEIELLANKLLRQQTKNLREIIWDRIYKHKNALHFNSPIINFYELTLIYGVLFGVILVSSPNTSCFVEHCFLTSKNLLFNRSPQTWKRESFSEEFCGSHLFSKIILLAQLIFFLYQF